LSIYRKRTKFGSIIASCNQVTSVLVDCFLLTQTDILFTKH